MDQIKLHVLEEVEHIARSSFKDEYYYKIELLYDSLNTLEEDFQITEREFEKIFEMVMYGDDVEIYKKGLVETLQENNLKGGISHDKPIRS
ncbi:MAG: hypothetical protein ACPLRS_02830 [Hydrogenobacter sp.]